MRKPGRLTVIGAVAAASLAGIGFQQGLTRAADATADEPSVDLVRSARNGPWSGHTVIYDLKSDQAIRSIHVAGMLTFASDRDTQLDVGLIKIQPGDDASEDGFNCDAQCSCPKNE